MTEHGKVEVFVIGSALRDVCGDQAALGLRFVGTGETAPRYRLFVVEEDFAALVEDERGGSSIKGEIVEVDSERLAELAATEPEGMAFQSIELSDGRTLLAAVGDRDHMLATATEITEFGGFAAYRSTRRRPPGA